MFFPKTIATSFLRNFGPRVCPGIVCFFLSPIIRVSLVSQNGCKPDATKSHIHHPLLLYVCTSMKFYLCMYIACVRRAVFASFRSGGQIIRTAHMAVVLTRFVCEHTEHEGLNGLLGRIDFAAAHADPEGFGFRANRCRRR